jgi:hypothetical protein
VSATTAEDTAAAVTLAATSSLGQPITYSVISTPSHGTLSGTAPNLTYTPAANYFGNDSFQYQTSDGTGLAIGTVWLTVTPVNDPPVARDLYLVATAGTPTALTLPVTDPDGDVLTVTVVTAPSHGTLSGTGPGLTYTPQSDYTGPDSFTYQVSDGSFVSDVATVAITVNSAPVLATAAYDSGLKVPRCASAASSCDSGTLLNGRGPLGPELNQPNTLGGTCPDGTSGTYHSTPSLDRLKVSTLDGSPLTAGKTVRIEATVWAWLTGGVDTVDLYYSASTTSPTWVRIGTFNVATAGAQVVSTTYTLPSQAGAQAIRGLSRYGGSPTSACMSSSYTDHDDLVFTVGARDTAVPTTSLTAPTAGAVVRGSVTLTASATDNVGVTKVEFYDGTTLLGTRTVPPYEYSWNTARAANGTHTLISQAYDVAGNVGTSAGVQVTVDNDFEPPVLILTSPEDGAMVSGTLNVTVDVTDNVEVARVDYAFNGYPWASVTMAPYSWSLSSRTMANTLHTITATAYDTSGNASEPVTLVIGVDNPSKGGW